MGEAYTKQSGSWASEIEALLEREGMPAELPQEENVEYLDTVGTESDEVAEDDLPEAAGPVGRGSPVLTSCDHAVLSRIRERGYAATRSEARASDEQIERLADVGLAYLRADANGEIVVAMAGATDGDVRRAANRARADEIGNLFEETAAICETVARALVARTRRLGGACSEEGLYGSLAAEHPREAVAAVLARERGLLRRVAGKSTSVRLVACAGATTEGMREAARRHRDAERTSEANRRLRHKVFAAPAAGDRPTGDTPVDPYAAEKAAEEFGAARKESIGRPLSAKARRWNQSGTPAPDPERIRRGRLRRAAAIRAKVEAADPEAVAWATARAVHLQGLDLAGRILYRVERHGGVSEISLLALARSLGPQESDARALLYEELTKLAGAGKIRRARRRSDGAVFFLPKQRADRDKLARDLLAVISGPENGITVPEGSRLAARLQRFRAEEARKEAQQVRLAATAA